MLKMRFTRRAAGSGHAEGSRSEKLRSLRRNDSQARRSERLRCLKCGCRSYADKMSARGAGGFRIWLPYIGGRKDAARLNLLAAALFAHRRRIRMTLADFIQQKADECESAVRSGTGGSERRFLRRSCVELAQTGS